MGWLVSLDCQNFCELLHASSLEPHMASFVYKCCTKPFSSPALIECWDFLWMLEKRWFPMDLQSNKKYILFYLTPLPLVLFSTILADPPPPLTRTYYMEWMFPNTILSRSSQQLPHLSLGPLKGSLSWYGALWGSTRFVRCFRNYRETRTPSGVPR